MASTLAASHTPLNRLLSTLVPQDSSQTHNKTPNVLAKGPFWARLPPVRPREPSSQSNGSQGINCPGANQASGAHGTSSGMPPIVAPDRIGTTRVMLQETQACVQKFAARMDKLGAAVEQGVKDVQLCRAAIEGAGDRTTADIADVVYKSQAALTQELEAQRQLINKTTESISLIISSNESLTRLYDAQSASLQSLHQLYATQQSALQTVQEQQYQIIQTLSPMESLIKCMPTQLEASQTSLIDKVLHNMTLQVPIAVEKAFQKLDLESVVSRLASGLNARIPEFVQGTPPEVDLTLASNVSRSSEPDIRLQTSRKRKRTDDEKADSAQSRRNRYIASSSVRGDSQLLNNARVVPTTALGPDLLSQNLSNLTITKPSPASSLLTNKHSIGPSVQEEKTTDISNKFSQVEDIDSDTVPSEKLTQTRLNFVSQKSTSQNLALAHPKRADIKKNVPSLHRAQNSPNEVHEVYPSETLSKASSDIDNTLSHKTIDNSKQELTLSTSPPVVDKSSSPPTVPSASKGKGKATLKTKAIKSRATKPKPTGKRKEKKRPTPPGAVPAALQNQNHNEPDASNKGKGASKAQSTSPTRLIATSSNEISVVSEHDPPNSPKQNSTKVDLPLESTCLLPDINAHRPDSGERKRFPLAPLQLEHGSSQQNARLSTPMRQGPSSSTLISLLGDDCSTPDWNMAGAALAMTKAEQDLDPLYAIPSSDGVHANEDPISSVIQNGGRQRRYLALESDSPGLDLWFDDLLDV